MADRVPYRPTPAGLAIHPHLNEPDTKFNADGVYKVKLKPLTVDDSQSFMGVIKKAAEAAFERVTKDLTPAEKKKWAVYYPFEEEEDADGNKTGFVIFHFKQNATIPIPDGGSKVITIGLYGTDDKPLVSEDGIISKVYSGSTLRVKYRPRDTKITSNKKAGVRLDFLKVQVIKLAEREDTGGFGAYDDDDDVADSSGPSGNEQF